MVISEIKKLAISGGLVLLAAVGFWFFPGRDRAWCLAGMKKLGKLIWVFYPIGQCLLIVCG